MIWSTVLSVDTNISFPAREQRNPALSETSLGSMDHGKRARVPRTVDGAVDFVRHPVVQRRRVGRRRVVVGGKFAGDALVSAPSNDERGCPPATTNSLVKVHAADSAHRGAIDPSLAGGVMVAADVTIPTIVAAANLVAQDALPIVRVRVAGIRDVP